LKYSIASIRRANATANRKPQTATFSCVKGVVCKKGYAIKDAIRKVETDILYLSPVTHGHCFWNGMMGAVIEAQQFLFNVTSSGCNMLLDREEWLFRCGAIYISGVVDESELFFSRHTREARLLLRRWTEHELEEHVYCKDYELVRNLIDFNARYVNTSRLNVLES
jgi:hypothetical protein